MDFNKPENYTNFQPKEMNELHHDDGSSKSTGNAFDWKSKKPTSTSSAPKRHDVKKVSTGTIYTKKSSEFDKEEPKEPKPVIKNDDGTVKRGRGRPPGKYGSYKKKIQEALDKYSLVSEEQLDELSKSTLGSYIKKSSTSAFYKGVGAGTAYSDSDHKTGAEKVQKGLKRIEGVKNATNKILNKESLEVNDLVSVESPTGQLLGRVTNITESMIGIKHPNVDGIKHYNPSYVSKLVEEEVDETLIEGVSWDRWDRSHKGVKGMSKSTRGSWMISKHANGYKYGHKEGEDHISVNGTGKEAAKAGSEWAKKNGHNTVYILESFTPESDNKDLTLGSIVNSALKL